MRRLQVATAQHAANAGRLDLWGGVECSVVRVADGWRDQVAETGHHDRIADLDLLAEAGITTLRYPVLWERVAPDDPGRPDWSWHDARMARLAALRISPVIGLLHHGSGPGYTDLLDPGFAAGVAIHAGRTASRYPWVTSWTPVNEPLTTARFSGLYGHWHPFHRDERAMLRMLANQCSAVRLSMRAIRAVNPAAQLVQTEDIGRVFSTAPLTYQADYENERRWLSLDLLCGRMNAGHPWWHRFIEAGVATGALEAFQDEDGAPDIIGVNRYVTSDRYLDHRTSLYPPRLRGTNGRALYADTEAARMDLPADLTGWYARLGEVWARYRKPVVVSEAHLGDAPAEQVRWLMEAWDAATRLRAEGADIRAVTAWALFGLVDWNSMLRERDGHFEAGAWDTRLSPPAGSLLAQAVSALAREGGFDHPCLDTPGWWRREDRLLAAATA